MMDSETRTRMLAVNGCLVAAMELLALVAQEDDVYAGDLLLKVAAAHNICANLITDEWQARADEIAAV